MLADTAQTERTVRNKRAIGVVLFSLSFALFAIASCNVADRKKADYLKTFDLSDKQVFELLASLQSEDFSNENFHVRYVERFNDSTGIIEVSVNNQLPDERIGLCKILQFDGSNVFVYSRGCKMAVPDKFASTSDQAPFYIPDAPYWMLLVRKGRHHLGLFELTNL